MRLSPGEVAAIKCLVAETYDPDAVVRLFGSRVDDHRHGGDVDLHIEVNLPGPYTTDRRRIEFRLHDRLEQALDERKVDLVIR